MEESIKPEVGKKIVVTYSDECGKIKDTHTIKDVKWSEWNDVVPLWIDTCCGRYIPTSGADGHWEGQSFSMGGWEIEDNQS